MAPPRQTEQALRQEYQGTPRSDSEDLISPIQCNRPYSGYSLWGLQTKPDILLSSLGLNALGSAVPVILS